MPNYDYECYACKDIYVVKESIKSEPHQECMICGEGPVRRIFGKFEGPVIFKGKGFYATDYKKFDTKRYGIEDKE